MRVSPAFCARHREAAASRVARPPLRLFDKNLSDASTPRRVRDDERHDVCNWSGAVDCRVTRQRQQAKRSSRGIDRQENRAGIGHDRIQSLWDIASLGRISELTEKSRDLRRVIHRCRAQPETPA